MLREFVDLVNETVDDGFTRGVNLFLESLEVDLAKSELFEQHTTDAVLTKLFEDANIELSGDSISEDDDLDDIDDEKLDALLKEYSDDEIEVNTDVDPIEE